MIDIRKGKAFAEPSAQDAMKCITRRKTLAGLAGILATACAPSITMGVIANAGSANASVGRGMMRNVGARNAAIFGAGKPYDAEVEYIETDGNSGIDTEVFATRVLEYNFKLSASSSFSRQGRNGVIGVLPGGDYPYQKAAYYDINHNYKGLRPTFGRYWEVSTPYDTSAHEYILNNTGDYVDGVVCHTWDDLFTMSGLLYTVGVGAARNPSGYNPEYICNAGLRFGFVKIKTNNVIAFDGIPVRIGSVGCMYDRISQRVFRSGLSGDFIPGPDI